MTTNVEHFISISAGPSREELVDAWRYAFSGISEIAEVQFTGMLVTVKNGVRMNAKKCEFKARILCLEHEDGSGFSFNLKVYATPMPVRDRLVRMYYSAKSRAGNLDLDQ